MKKYFTLLSFLCCTFFAQAQIQVLVTIDVSADAEVTDVMFKGTPTSWADIQGYDDGTNGDVTAGDNVWSVEFTVECDGTNHEWGAVDQNGAWLLASGTANRMFTVDQQCLLTGDTDYAIPMVGGAVLLKLTVRDLNNDIQGISIKGAYDSWASVPAYDDGTNGDATAGDGEWTLEIMADMPPTGGDPITYEWGAERTDCDNAAWLIIGDNRAFTVDDQGNISGQQNYDVPLSSTTYNVTFRVYMGNEIVSSDGLYVSGEFETCKWSKQDIQLTQNAEDPNVYEATTPVAPGVYKWKFFNGSPGTDDGGENNGGTPFATVFQDEGCGVDNGFGGSNRETDLSGLSSDMVLDIFVFNSCNIYTIIPTKDELIIDKFEVKPNPMTDAAIIEFTNDNAEAFDIIVTDFTGKKVISYNNITDNRVEINATNLSSGIYFATLRNQEGKSTSQKIIVQ